MPTVQINDIETYYERWGSGPPVVFVHGAVVDYTQWEPQLDALSDAYTTIAYDVRGHGRTGGSDRETYSIDRFADDLAALVAALELDRPVVCGLSLGGCIAQVYAERYPDGLSGLVLADTFGPTPLSPTEHVQRQLLGATVPLVRLFGYERVERAMMWFQERLSKGVSGEYENIEAIRASGPTMATEEFAKVIRALARFDEIPVGTGRFRSRRWSSMANTTRDSSESSRRHWRMQSGGPRFGKYPAPVTLRISTTRTS
ncbi:alpha/beta fold hydrolase [Salinibaculum rarum]|uniref:alpha/beta fold hydrolase n=1 Tax=Salinibaculum rarum TaxID=3058903 RepID=UPI00265EF14A|nr:alpha/beta hydrolase [Salinibaculum sp. KK48]